LRRTGREQARSCKLYNEFDIGSIGTGVAIGDYDNDGRPDASVMAEFCDYDWDGWLDVFILTNLLDSTEHPNGQRSYLFITTETALSPR
jgi:hypothetical protein